MVGERPRLAGDEAELQAHMEEHGERLRDTAKRRRDIAKAGLAALRGTVPVSNGE